jgi:hypothetical protein
MLLASSPHGTVQLMSLGVTRKERLPHTDGGRVVHATSISGITPPRFLLLASVWFSAKNRADD